MHDGSMQTLREVIDHYAAAGRVIADGPLAGDGRANPSKDPLISQIELSKQDRDDIVAYLRTLTDTSVTTDPDVSDPFKQRAR
jgi:cytochrome c peroxidase